MNKTTVISVVNLKGGVGKTSLTLNLGDCLSRMGNTVLLVDADGQANLTMALGYPQPDELAATLPQAIREQIKPGAQSVDADDYILSAHGMDFIPSCIELAGLESVLINTISRETVLRRLLATVKDDYDYILIDCSPSMGIVTLNALTAADYILIPTQPQFFSAKGLELLLATIAGVKQTLNSNLEIAGAVITMYNSRLRFHRQVVDTVSAAYGEHLKVFNSTIPLSVRVTEAQAAGISLLDHDPSGKVAAAYYSLAREVVEIVR